MGEDTQTVQLSAGPNRWLKLTGSSAFLTVIALAGIGVVGYMWGPPFPLKETLLNMNAVVIDHTDKNTMQHDDMRLAIRWNTYVQWACSPNNISDGAKKKCSEIDLMKPEPEDQVRRRYRIPRD